jgi:hypothetical protein
LSFIVGWPLAVRIAGQVRYATGSTIPILGLGGGRVTVGIGACVIWHNPSREVDMDIVFDDPTHVAPVDSAFREGVAICKTYSPQDTTSGGVRNRGHIAPWRATEFYGDGTPIETTSGRSRAFPNAGIYTYRSPQHDYEGTLIVCDELQDATCAPENYKWGEVEQRAERNDGQRL